MDRGAWWAHGVTKESDRHNLAIKQQQQQTTRVEYQISSLGFCGLGDLFFLTMGNIEA